MNNENRIEFVESDLDFLIALSKPGARDLHPDDAKEAIVQHLRDTAARMKEHCIVSAEITRSGVYRVKIQFPRRRLRVF